MVIERIATIQKVKICLSKDEISVKSVKVTFQFSDRAITKIFCVMKDDSTDTDQLRALMTELRVKKARELSGKKVSLVLLKKKSKIIAFRNEEKNNYILIFSCDSRYCCRQLSKELMQKQIEMWEERLSTTQNQNP